MLSRKYRLNKALVKEVISSGKVSQNKFFKLIFKQNNLPYHRLSAVVPKKTIKSAVGRNRIKRVIREILRNSQKETQNGFDVVVFYKNKSELPFSELKKELILFLDSTLNVKT